MHMTGIKVSMLSAVAVSAFPAQVDTVEPWFTFIRAAGVTGCLIIALVYVFREGKERQARLEELVHQGNEAARLLAVATATKAEVDRANTQAMFQIAAIVENMTVSCREIHDLHRTPSKVPSIQNPEK
jgi:hypothetical protein